MVASAGAIMGVFGKRDDTVVFMQLLKAKSREETVQVKGDGSFYAAKEAEEQNAKSNTLGEQPPPKDDSQAEVQTNESWPTNGEEVGSISKVDQKIHSLALSALLHYPDKAVRAAANE